MAELTYQRDETNVILSLLISRGLGVTGETPTVALRNPVNGEYLDWADLTFKAAGWTTRQQTLTEVDATNSPGLYQEELDFTSVTNLPTNTDVLVAEYENATFPRGADQDLLLLVNHYKDLAVSTDILNDATPFAGANIDAAVSSRAAPGDAMDLVANAVDATSVATDAIDADALATSAVNEISADVDTVLSGSHGAGSWEGASAAATATAVWSEALPGAFGAGEAGNIVGNNLDASVADVLADTAAIDARLPADPADESNQLAQHAQTQSDIAALNDLSIADVQTAMTNQGYTAARAPNLDNLDAAVSSRSSHTAVDVDTQLSGTHGAGSWEGSNLLEYCGAIWIDVTNGAAGTVVGTNGTPGNPVNSLADAVTLAAATGFRQYNIRDGFLTLTSAHPTWRFVGLGTNVGVDVGGQDVEASFFVDCYAFGTFVVGSTGVQMLRGGLGPASGVAGYFYECPFYSTITPASGTPSFNAFNCDGSSFWILDCSNLVNGDNVTLQDFHGNVQVNSLGANTARVTLSGDFAATVSATCTDGQLLLLGTGDLVDNSGGAVTFLRDGFVEPEQLVDDIHREPAADHAAVAGSMAQYIVAAGGGAGGMHVALDGGSGTPNAQYNVNNQLTQARLRFFDTEANAVASTPGNAALETGELFRTEIQSGDAAFGAGNLAAIPQVLQQLIRRGP